MTKAEIISRIGTLSDQHLIDQVAKLLSSFSSDDSKGSPKRIFKFAGSLKASEAEHHQSIINTEFGKIEGEW